MKFVSAIIASLALLLVSATATELVRPGEVEAWLEKHPDAVLIDVRTPREFDGGHIEGAKMIVWGGNRAAQREFKKRVREKLDPERPVLIICRSGRRSSQAAKAMEQWGFTTLADLRGGMLAWEKADQPVIVPAP